MAKLPFVIELRENAKAELNALRPFDKQRISEAIETQLSYEPFRVTRNRKPIPGVVPSFEYAPPLWELRVEEFRVFYDGTVRDRRIVIRAIRVKPPGKTTQEIV